MKTKWLIISAVVLIVLYIGGMIFTDKHDLLSVDSLKTYKVEYWVQLANSLFTTIIGFLVLFIIFNETNKINIKSSMLATNNDLWIKHLGNLKTSSKIDKLFKLIKYDVKNVEEIIEDFFNSEKEARIYFIWFNTIYHNKVLKKIINSSSSICYNNIVEVYKELYSVMDINVQEAPINIESLFELYTCDNDFKNALDNYISEELSYTDEEDIESIGWSYDLEKIDDFQSVINIIISEYEEE